MLCRILVECLFNITLFHTKDLTGGSTVFFLASYAYITDISSPEMRTTRIALVDGLFPLGFYSGTAFAGPIQKHLGEIYNFGFGMFFALLAVLYTIFFLKDSRVELNKKLEADSEISNSTNNTEETTTITG